MDAIVSLSHTATLNATLIIFILTYIGIAAGKIYGLALDRTGIVLLGSIAMLAFGCISLPQAMASISAPSIILLFSLMVIASQLRYAGFYTRIAHIIAGYLEHPAKFLAVLMVSSGVLSAFLNNDVICLAFAPIISTAALNKRYNPVPFLIALALSSNIGCTLTTIGNAQNVLVGQLANLSFGHYMLWVLVPVSVAMLCAYLIVYYLSRSVFTQVDPVLLARYSKEEPRPYYVWRTAKGLTALVVIVILFLFSNIPHYLIALTVAGIVLCNQRLKSKKILSGVDWQLLLLFVGLFVVVGAFRGSGLAQIGVQYLNQTGVNLKDPYMLAITSGVLSNLINNSATVMLLVNLTDLHHPINAYVLALSNSFAGNLLLIGSMANIVVVQSARKMGIKISFLEFARYGIPTALSSIVVLLLWVYMAVALGF